MWSVAGNCRVILFPIIIPRPISIIILLLLMLHFLTCINYSSARNSITPTCTSPSPHYSSCGNIPVIKSPFILKTDPKSRGLQPGGDCFLLDCENNRTILKYNSSVMFFVEEINYKKRKMRLLDPGIYRGNLSSCPRFSFARYRWLRRPFWATANLPGLISIAFIQCLSNVDNVKYVKASFCEDRRNMFANSSKFYSFMFVYRGKSTLDDLVENCTVDGIFRLSASAPIMEDNSSLANIYDALAYGFEVEWWTGIRSIPLWVTGLILVYSVVAIVALAPVKFIIGFPLLIWLVVHTWQRRHLSIDKAIEEFLQGQHNLVPIKYNYSEIKKMTTNFAHKLGEGAHGIVYKGKLRSGYEVAIKMMKQSIMTDEEFINEVGTIGQIHHVNVVQLIGFCVERSNYALVYEFLPNGSLDGYIFNQQSIGALTMTLEKMFDIASGVAHGIAYLHHGCNMRILHFDIKPHNILLDEKLNPKISDFGLAQLYSIDQSFINLTVARGTVGYMAPEMFYKNFGGISSKADVYSFGMMLMEMVCKRKDINPFIEDTNQTHFPPWVYDQLHIGNDIDIQNASEDERLMVKKIIIVALWCIQIRPSDRPSMIKVIGMFEGDIELHMPPMPFISPQKVEENNQAITITHSVHSIRLELLEN